MIKYCTSKNKIKAIRQLVQTLCIFYFESVTNRELDVLCEIIHAGEVGYSSKITFILNYKSTKENYSQLLDRLSKKGILIKKPNRSGKEVHSYFKDVKDIVENKKDKFIIIEYDAID